MGPSFELFDHTADMGVRVRAANLNEIIPAAVEGFYATIGELVCGADEQPFEFHASGLEPEMLVRDFLTELLILFERHRRRLSKFNRVDFSESNLHVQAAAAVIDEGRSCYHREVKAVTYHDLTIRPAGGGFEATFIVDI